MAPVAAMAVRMMRTVVLCLLAAAGIDAAAAVAAAQTDRVSFNRDVRPIMSDTCFRCHGPDRSARKADMRLDLRDEATRPTRSGRTPIVPGDPDKSQIIARIFATGANVMPPTYAHKELTQTQKETIRRWVAEGAVYEGHWAYQPVKRPAPPTLADRSLVKNPIDAFIQDRLRREGMTPAREADKRTLLRRFTREQIAGDLLPNATLDQRVASAYNRLNRTSAEGGLQPKEYLAKYGADRVRTLSAVWLGSTLGCAECHDHKFDPFLTRDFYAMKAFFADVQETGLVPDRGIRAWGAKLALPTDAQRAELARLDAEIAAAKTRLDDAAAASAADTEAHEIELKTRWEAGELTWTWQHPIAARALNGATVAIYDKEPIESNF